MSFRTAYGNTWSEAGWRMCNRDECILPPVDLPFINTAPVRKGDAATVLGAWLHWYHNNVEPLTSPVWGWSLLNDVGTSNHLAGVGVDVNAPKYPWGFYRMSGELQNRVQTGLDLFKGFVFWGRVWGKPDEMHYQLGVPEFDADGVPNRRLAAFAQELRDGYLGVYAPPKPKDPKEFPLPLLGGDWGPTWFFGPLDGPEQSVSGEWTGDSQEVKDALGRWQEAAGVPVTKRWDAATKRAAQAIQAANGWQTEPNGYIYQGEWDVVVKGGQRPDYDAKPPEPFGFEYADVSHFQSPLSDAYPSKFVMFRVNNGNEVDRNAAANLAWAKAAVAAGKLEAFGVYAFWRPNEDTEGTFRRVVGEPHPRMVAMVDVEGAEGSQKGPVPPGQSERANGMVNGLRSWLGKDRVMGYWNMRANPNHWPVRVDIPFVVPDYSADKGKPRFPYPGWRIHQYTDKGRMAPWSTPVDLNYFPGTLTEFLGMFGMKKLAEAETPPPVTEPVAPEESGVTTKVANITGPGTSAVQFGVGGTDLGICRKLPNGKTAVVLGDTFEQFTVGGPGWRSPLILLTDDDTLAELNAGGLQFNGSIGGSYARQLWAYNHDGPPWTNGGFGTVLPTDILVVGSRVYLHVAVCRGLEAQWTEIAYSDDNGETWQNGGPAASKPADYAGGFQRGITWELVGDHVYIMGSSWLTNGGSNVRMWRVHKDSVLNRDAWEPWGYDGAWGWGKPAADLLPAGTKVREMNLRALQGVWVWTMTTTAPSVKVATKFLPVITDNWHTAPAANVVTNTSWGMEWINPNNTLAQPYGGYLVPGSTLDELHVLVSQWDTLNGDNWPYQIVQFKLAAPAAVPRNLGGGSEPEPEPEPEPLTLAQLVDQNYLIARRILDEETSADLSDLPATTAAGELADAQNTNKALRRLADELDTDLGGL